MYTHTHMIISQQSLSRTSHPVLQDSTHRRTLLFLAHTLCIHIHQNVPHRRLITSPSFEKIRALLIRAVLMIIISRLFVIMAAWAFGAVRSFDGNGQTVALQACFQARVPPEESSAILLLLPDTCMYVCINMYMYILCMCVYICIYVCVCVCVYIYIYIYIRGLGGLLFLASSNESTKSLSFAYIHTHRHTHTHI